jgi:hypothetical protein
MLKVRSEKGKSFSKLGVEASFLNTGSIQVEQSDIPILLIIRRGIFCDYHLKFLQDPLIGKVNQRTSARYYQFNSHKVLKNKQRITHIIMRDGNLNKITRIVIKSHFHHLRLASSTLNKHFQL